MEKILKLIYPSRCPICDRIRGVTEEVCCPLCREKLPWTAGSVCIKCGKPVEAEREYCDDCCRQRHLFTQGVAAFTYSDGLPDALYRLKFQNRRDYVDFFAAAMVRAGRQKLNLWNVQAVIPVPMHWKKKIRRGYNQAELLAAGISRRTGIPLEKKLLCAVRRPAEQKYLNRRERQKNLRGCFSVCKPLAQLERVLVVDDVYTTGSTMDEIARVLKLAGVKKVFFLVLCTGKGKKDSMHGEKSVLY